MIRSRTFDAAASPCSSARFQASSVSRISCPALSCPALMGWASTGMARISAATPVGASATEELRELVRLRDRVVQDYGEHLPLVLLPGSTPPIQVAKYTDFRGVIADHKWCAIRASP